ncbi:exodeoxyribonuclease VII small subunit [Romeria aff. gracilis LEGE 07310]|uniref:Exodeoxyribonuclease 7 small subunit n=2 Tax=Vasconcelosia TaxID=3366328 RepID=A0A8J7AG38_9CYAN|nr:exodeoxyribonuclease VII small subunit [Romeria aff. gracilis LEGE 07310]
MSSPQKTERSQDWSYEETLRQVEAIVTQLETGEMPLAEVFEQFSVAIGGLRQCDQFLQEKQQQMSLLVETLVDSPDSTEV